MNIFTLAVEPRTTVGSANMRRLRKNEGRTPAVIYGAGKEVQPVTVLTKTIQRSLENEAFYSRILTLDVAGDKQKVVLKAVHRHPWKTSVLHLDFYRINEKEKLDMTIPIHFKGAEESPGVIEGGVVSHQMNDLEVRCLPSDLPEFIEIDISGLKMDETLHLSQIKLPKGVELVALAHGADLSHDHAVVSVHLPVLQAEPEEETAEAAEGAEGEETAATAEGGADEEGEASSKKDKKD